MLEQSTGLAQIPQAIPDQEYDRLKNYTGHFQTALPSIDGVHPVGQLGHILLYYQQQYF